MWQRGYIGLNPCFSGGWSRRLYKITKTDNTTEVLILVLVEDGLGGHRRYHTRRDGNVLILVLVEDGLGVMEKDEFCRNWKS